MEKALMAEVTTGATAGRKCMQCGLLSPVKAGLCEACIADEKRLVASCTLPDGSYDRVTTGQRIHAAVLLGPRTLAEIQALLPGVHPANVEAALAQMGREGEVVGRSVPRSREPAVAGRVDHADAEVLCALAEEHDAKATPGPWRERCGALKHYCFSADAGEDFGFSLQEHHWKDGREVPAHANAAFVAAARATWPALAKVTRALLAENARLHEALGHAEKAR